MNITNIVKNLFRRNNLLNYYKNQYEKRDFSKNQLIKHDNYVNYHLTKEFREYKPNFKKYSVADDVNYIKYLDSIK